MKAVGDVVLLEHKNWHMYVSSSFNITNVLLVQWALRTAWAVTKLDFFDGHFLGVIRVAVDTQVVFNKVVKEFFLGMRIVAFLGDPCEPGDLKDAAACSCFICSLPTLIVHKGLLARSEEVDDWTEDCDDRDQYDESTQEAGSRRLLLP
jgi:hypothetical protein